MLETLLQDLAYAMEDLDDDRVNALIHQLLEADADRLRIQDALNDGIYNVGKRFENGEYFLADLIVSGVIYQEALALFTDPARETDGDNRLGTVVIGVGENDIHDIGKNIICSTLKAAGFHVIDLGVDLKPEIFADAVARYEPDILAMSGVMGSTLSSMESTVALLTANQLRGRVSIVIGGSCITSGDPRRVGADFVATTPMETVTFCKSVVRNRL